jgi:hypothetical protein
VRGYCTLAGSLTNRARGGGVPARQAQPAVTACLAMPAIRVRLADGRVIACEVPPERQISAVELEHESRRRVASTHVDRVRDGIEVLVLAAVQMVCEVIEGVARTGSYRPLQRSPQRSRGIPIPQPGPEQRVRLRPCAATASLDETTLTRSRDRVQGADEAEVSIANGSQPGDGRGCWPSGCADRPAYP